MTVVGVLACLLQLSTATAIAEAPLLFEFSAGGNANENISYEAARGFGFEPAAKGDSGRRFSIRLPEGNYRVTLQFGASNRASLTTVAAETRRLMLEDVATERGQFVERTFIVNVRTPALVAPPANAPGGSTVRLNARETGSPTWDDKLTLEFIGPTAAIDSLSIASANVPTLYLTGDSTVTDQRVSPAASWGQILPRFFDDRIVLANHAESGETLKSFLTELRFDKLLATLRSGDWVLIQFGHNDQKTQWPQTYVEAGTTYKAYLRTYIAEVRRRGATPILVTAPERGNFDAAGRIVASHGAYPDAVRAVAKAESIALIDLHARSKAFYETLGPQRIAKAFSDGGKDRTHHSNYGAYQLAREVVSELRRADPEHTAHLAKYLLADDPLADTNTNEDFNRL